MYYYNSHIKDMGGEYSSKTESKLPFLSNFVSVSGKNDPGWQKYLGVRNMTTVHEATEASYSNIGRCTVDYREHWNFGIFRELEDGGVPPYSGLNNLWYTIAEDDDTVGRTAAKLLSKIYEIQRGEFAGGVFLGEIVETIHLIKHPFDSMITAMSKSADFYKKTKRALDAINSGTYKHAGRIARTQAQKSAAQRSVIKAWNDVYLEMTYAVLPFFGEIEGLRKQIQAIAKRKRYSKARATGSFVKTEKFSIDTDHMVGYSLGHKITQSCKRKVIGVAQVDLGATPWDYNPDSFGLRLRDFVPTLYELFPWSFIADYVSNLGQYIEGALAETSKSPWNYMLIIDEYETQIYTEITWGLLGPPWVDWQRASIEGTTAQKRVVKRVAINWDDDPIYGIKWPSTKQFLNIASLLLAFNLGTNVPYLSK